MEVKLSEKKIEEVLQKEIINVLHKPIDLPEKYTILGSDINQIRHIFYYLKSEKVPIKVSYSVDSYTGFIVHIEDILAEISILGFEETSHRRLLLSFNFMNSLYQFEVTIHRVIKDRIFFFLPLNIQFVSRRKYPRFYPSNLYAMINIEYIYLFSQKEYEQQFHQQYTIVAQELKKTNPDIQIITRILLYDIIKISPSFQLIFFNQNQIPKQNEWLVKQLMSIKKTIYIENVESLNSYFIPIQNVLFTNLERIYKTMLRTKTEEDVIRYFESMRTNDLRNQLHSYIISPIFLFDSMFGYLYLETRFTDRKRIYMEDATKITIISKALSYALTKKIIHNSFFLEPKIEVKNISLSGILLKVHSPILYDYLIENDILRIRLVIKNKQIECLGIIVRMFSLSPNEYYIALELVEYFEDSFSVLENYLYNLSKKWGDFSPSTTEFRE